MEAGAAGTGRVRTLEDEDAMSWWDLTKRVFAAGRAHGITDWAASLTYYGVLAIFPALIALVSILGLVGASATDPLIDNLTELTPGAAAQIIRDAVEEVGASRGTAGVAFVIGIVGALWSASGYVGAFGRATNVIYATDEGRPFWKLRPLQLAVTALLVMLLALTAVAVVVTGPLAEKVGNVIGAGDIAVTTWDFAKWPVIAIVVVVSVSILYYAAPNVRQEGLRAIAPGAGIALLIWIMSSLAFAIFVANFASYNATYGTIAGIIVFLVWLWISNIAVLAGAELNAELERNRELRAGMPPEETLALPPREAPTA
jgi:membrane protein